MYPVSDPQLVIDSRTFKCTPRSALSTGATCQLTQFASHIPNYSDNAHKQIIDQVSLRMMWILFKVLILH